VRTEAYKAERVFCALRKKLTPRAMDNVPRLWLSEEAGCDEVLFRYIRKIFDAKDFAAENDLADPDIREALRVARRVLKEEERLAGFARFQKTRQGVYFAAMAPVHNTLPLLLRHFAERFSDQDWILYDTVRRRGVLRRNAEWHEIFMDRNAFKNGVLDIGLLADGEELLQDLWQGYYRAIAIRERLNPRLQTRCMPKRFWAYLTERPELTETPRKKESPRTPTQQKAALFSTRGTRAEGSPQTPGCAPAPS
jgi:probable DNA metabolism protein